MTQPQPDRHSRAVQSWPETAPPSRPTHMRVSLAFVEHRVNVWLRFGKPAREIILDRWRRVATFAPGEICCRVKWIGNDYGTALWQIMVMQVPTANYGEHDTQRIAGVVPGARILLRGGGERQVKAVLEVIDAIEALGIDPCAVATTYWRTVANRLASRLPLPEYTAARHAAHLARGALQ